MTSSKQLIVATVVGLNAAFAVAPTVAIAHVTLQPDTARPNSAYRGVLVVPHGCDGQRTVRLEVTLPANFVLDEPAPPAGWTVDVVSAQADGQQVDPTLAPAAPAEIVWSLVTGEVGAETQGFALHGRIADVPAGTVLAFPTIQGCEGHSVAWSDVAHGQDGHSLAHPAPVLVIEADAPTAAGSTAAVAHAHAPAPAAAGRRAAGASVVAGDLAIAQAWVRGTPPGATVSAGYLTITNNGAVVDRLIGGRAEFAGAVMVHAMSVADGVMTMRGVADGLVVAPGETVTLAPGGSHVMFTDVVSRPLPGTEVTVTLTFERAGDVVLTMPVSAFGALSPGVSVGGDQFGRSPHHHGQGQ